MILSVVLFVLLIVSISSLRTKLLFELQGIFLLIFGSAKMGLWLYTILMLPGTILHELSHWIVAEILRVRTGEIHIFPEGDGENGEQRLGSVATGSTDPIRGFLIGVAPFFVGIATLGFLGYFWMVGWGIYSWWAMTLIGYGLVVVGNSMIISGSDRRYFPFMAVLLVVVALALYYANLTPSFSNLEFLISSLYSVNLVLGLTIGATLVMISLLYIVRRALERVTRKRVSR